MADIYLRDVFAAAATEDESLPAPKVVSVSRGELEKLTGDYLRTVRRLLWTWGDDDYLARRIYLEDDTLIYFRDLGEFTSRSHEHKLAPLGNDRFYTLDSPGEVIVSFTSPTPGQPRQMIVVVDGGKPSVFDAVEPVSPSPFVAHLSIPRPPWGREAICPRRLPFRYRRGDRCLPLGVRVHQER